MRAPSAAFGCPVLNRAAIEREGWEPAMKSQVRRSRNGDGAIRVTSCANGNLGGIASACASAALLVLNASSSEACVAGQSIGTVGCETKQAEPALPSLLNADPVAGRVTSHLDGKPWIAQAWTTLPMAVAKSDDVFSLQASLDHYHAFEVRQFSAKIEEAKALAPDRVIVPKPPVSPNKRVDVWGAVDVDAAQHGEVARSRVGIDYRAWRNTVVGAMLDVDVDEAQSSFGRGQRFATYVVMKLPSFASVDATADWGEEFLNDETKLAVHFRGNVEMPGGVKFSPTVGMTGTYPGQASQDDADVAEQSTLTFAPKLSRSFQLDQGLTVEPSVSLSTDTSDKRSAGAGVTIKRPDSYSLSLGTSVERSAETEQPPNMRGNLNLTVPLP